jgi:hypothetical protein
MIQQIKNKIEIVSRWLANVNRRFPANSNLEDLANHFKTQSLIGTKDLGRCIAYQGVEDPFFLALFGAIMQDVKNGSRAESHVIFTRSLEGAMGFGVKSTLLRSLIFSWPMTSQWANLYKIFADKIGYRTQNLIYPFSDLIDLFNSYLVWKDLVQDPKKVVDIKIDNILIGDLLIDTYLRFRPSATFNIRDRFNWIILWQAFKDIKRAKNYFQKVKPLSYVSTYATYIQHGVPVRVALSQGVKVFTFGSYNIFGKQLSNADFYQTPDASQYRRVFNSLPNEQALIARAEAELKKRFSGERDFATAYMNRSAYAKSLCVIPDLKGHVAIFLHNFYDSPHVYPELIFNDFWEWIVFTIEELKKNDIPFFLKPHPNQSNMSADVVAKLSRIYADVKIISAEISNIQLIEAGIVAAITVYGTIAHEMAYFGIPSIACARHPHHSYTFCKTAKNIDEYAKYLKNPACLPLPKDAMKIEALSFFYMHNLFGGVDDINLRIAFSRVSELSKADWEKNNDKFIGELKKMRALESYKHFIKKLIGET